MPKVPKITILRYLCNISRKTRMKSIFWQQINIKGFFRLMQYKVVSPSMAKLPKIASSLFLCNILRKKWVMKLIFCMQLSIKFSYKLILYIDFNTWGANFFYKLILLLLMGVIKHSQSTGNNKFAIYLEYPKNEVRDGIHFLHADKHKLLILF